MKEISRTILLTGLAEKVEAHLRLAIDVLQNTSEDLLHKQAPDSGWSIAQCLEHLNRYGNFYLPEIRKGLERSKSAGNPWFKSSWVGYQFTRMMDPVTGKMKIKTFKDYAPPPHLDAHAVVAEFIAQQETLLQLLRIAENTDLNKVRIPVSVARFIRLKLGDVFQFLIAHNERHIVQAKRHLSIDRIPTGRSVA